VLDDVHLLRNSECRAALSVLADHVPEGSQLALADELRDRLTQAHGSTAPGASALTGAELRLLPMLSTHLSFAEVGAEMSLSRNTVSSQAMSV